MISGTFKKLKEQASGALKTFAEPGSGDPEGPTEASVYKSLLVDLQYNQLLISREYQELFKQKEEEIKRLKKVAGEPVEDEASDLASPKKEAQGAKPMKDLSPEDIKIVLKEWDRKMRNNIVQKTEALAEAQIYRESVELLRAQLDGMRETIKEQTAQIAMLEKGNKKHGNHDHSRAEHAAGMEKLVQEFSIIQDEANKTREKLLEAELTLQALRTKIASDAETIAILSQNSPGDGAEVQQMLQKRDEEHEKMMNELREEFSAKQAKLEEELEKTSKELDEARHSMKQLQDDLASAFAMQADVVSRTKKQAEEEVQAVSVERDEAVQQLKEKESALKDAQEKLARAEQIVHRMTKDNDELLQSRSLSSQKDLEQKEKALESTRQELYAAQQALDDHKASSQASLTALMGKIEGKEGEITTLKERIEGLEEERSVLALRGAQSVEEAALVRRQLEEKTQAYEEELGALKVASEQEQTRLQTALDKSMTELKEAKSKYEETVAVLDSVRSRVQQLSEEVTMTTKRLEDVSQDKTRLEGELTDARSEMTRMSAEMLEMKRQLDETAKRIEKETQRVRQEMLEEQAQRLKEQSEAHAAELGKARKETAEYKELYSKETLLRRQAHDELMDIKGNIRVFARVRPVLAEEKQMAEAREGAGAADVVTEFPPESGGRDLVVKREGAREGLDAKFEFDQVFDPSSTQDRVFETVAPLIVSVMDGVNVTLFAYGQTGSGKTFTMEGTKEDPGVNIRALQRVFEIAKQRSSTYSYSFAVSVLEVYMETILDLLGDVESKDAREKLDIRQHPDTKVVFVQGLNRKPVTNMTEVQEILTLASKNRTVGAHNMNEHSSRSHLVFTLTAIGSSLVKKERFEGNLNLIDLAGSERLGKTDATGERLKEAQSINKSLSALGDVINALALKNGHIPFRNSKLTYLLQDQLQGNAKVGFFANVSPTAFNSSETICTLNFAARCRKTELGKAKKNVVGGADSTEQLMKENARLKRLVEELQGGNGKLDTSFTSGSTQTTPVRTPSRGIAAPPPSTSSGVKRALEKE